jgi:hypothetical protein
MKTVKIQQYELDGMIEKIEVLSASLAPIMEVYEKFIPMLAMMKGNSLAISTFPFTEAFMEVWQAIVKSVEGKEIEIHPTL